MKTYLLFVGDKNGLVDGADYLKQKGNRDQKQVDLIKKIPRGYAGPTGGRAGPDPEFVAEMILRRSALKLSAIRLSKLAGYSGAYVSMIETGARYPSNEAKLAIRKTLSDLEEKA